MDHAEHPQLTELRRKYLQAKESHLVASNMLIDLQQAGTAAMLAGKQQHASLSKAAHVKAQEIIDGYRDAMDAAEAAYWLAADLLCPNAQGRRDLYAWLDASDAVPA